MPIMVITLPGIYGKLWGGLREAHTFEAGGTLGTFGEMATTLIHMRVLRMFTWQIRNTALGRESQLQPKGEGKFSNPQLLGHSS